MIEAGKRLSVDVLVTGALVAGVAFYRNWAISNDSWACIAGGRFNGEVFTEVAG